VVAALTLAVVGWTVLSRRGGLGGVAQPNPAQRSTSEVLTHPLVVVFVLSQLVTMVISFAQV
jgi:hypothetical protein